MRIKGKTVYCLDRSACPRTIMFDPTECHFKLALLRNNYEEMLYIICTSTLLGQSIIAYLQQKGFPKVNLFISSSLFETPDIINVDRVAFCSRQEHRV